MDLVNSLMASSFLILPLLLSLTLPLSHGKRVLVIFIFGDSVVDVGNNNDIPTIIKANFPPYGREFINNTSTGRFSDGKLATDFIAEMLGFDSYQPAYLSREATGTNLLIGANFISAASELYDETAVLFNAIPLLNQLDNYKGYQEKVMELVRTDNASLIFSRGIHLISAGNSDFLQNYYINPLLNIAQTPEQFSNVLTQQDLYGLGARKIGVTTLAPIRCLPTAITLFGLGQNECVERLNHDALVFNEKLNETSELMKNRFTDLVLVVFHIYQPLFDLISNPMYLLSETN